MINFSETTKLKYTKQEKENVQKMQIFFKYQDIMQDAKKAKADYLDCKNKNTVSFDDKNRIALTTLTAVFKEDALHYWDKAERLRNKYFFLNEMIRLKK